jgi:hypothetical protein
MLDEQGVGPKSQPQEATPQGAISVGTEVEAPLFLDEPVDYAAAAPAPETSSAFDLFADEREPRAPDATPSANADAGAPPTIRVHLLAVFFLAAAVAAFATVRACQTGGMSTATIWELFGR